MTETPQSPAPEPTPPTAAPVAPTTPAAPPVYAAPPAQSAPTYAAPTNAAPTYAAAPAGPPTNTLAIIGFVASLLGILFILPFIGPIAGIILGYQAKKKIAETGEGGAGLASAAIWIGWIAVGLGIIATIGVIVFWGVLFAASVATS